MSPELEQYLLRRVREVYDAGKRGRPREQECDLAVIVIGAKIDEEVRLQVQRALAAQP